MTRAGRLVSAAVLIVAVSLGASACLPVPPPPPPPTEFTFVGGGWGHGVGMSQYGAKAMADARRSYSQILSTYYPGTALQTRTPSDDLRVLVAQRRATLTFVTGGTTTFGAAGTVPASSTVQATRDGDQVRLSGALSAVLPELTITFAGVLSITETGNGYRYGDVALKPDGGGVRAVITGLTMQQYLYGLAEMPALWHAEALRAQAVAARTYAQNRRDSRVGSGLDHDLLATVTDQVYSGTTHEHPRWTAAVNFTNTQFVTYRGALANTVYSSSNGGHSASSAYVWGTELAYLPARPDGYESAAVNPNYSWSRTYGSAELGAWFGVGTVRSITISGNIESSGRVDRATVRVEGTTGSVTLTGNQFRATVNANNPTLGTQLLSTKFVVK